MNPVILDHEANGIAVIRLNRPKSLNAINMEVIDQLHAAIDEAEGDSAVRAVVLTGEGAGFCAGLDLDEGHAARPGTEDMTEVPRQMMHQVAITAFLEKIHTSRKPYIAAVNGVAVGGGLALALACDVRVASTEGKFGAVFIKVGVSNTDLGISYLLPRIVGAGRSAELLLSGRIFDAAEADRIGLLSALVQPGDLMSKTIEVAEQIISNGAFQLWMTKETMWQNIDAPSYRHAILTENRTQIMASMAGDCEAAFEAFREGRKPEWKAM